MASTAAFSSPAAFSVKVMARSPGGRRVGAGQNPFNQKSGLPGHRPPLRERSVRSFELFLVPPHRLKIFLPSHQCPDFYPRLSMFIRVTKNSEFVGAAATTDSGKGDKALP
jgi:hypothetical protein